MTKEEKKKKKADLTKERLFEVAIELFLEKGFHQTTMRDIAKGAGLTPGASYYHYSSKNEFVLEFYQKTLDESLESLPQIIDKYQKFEDRLVEIARQKFEQLEEYETLVTALVENASGPNNPLSPFSRQSAPVRELAMSQFEKIIEGSDLKIKHHEHKEKIVKLLWFQHMTLIYFWIHDRSRNKTASKKLAKVSSEFLKNFFKLSQVKVIKGFVDSLFEQIDIVDAVFEK